MLHFYILNKQNLDPSRSMLSESSIKIKQEMPSRQQKSAKKDLERYLMFGPNHILVTLRCDDGHFPGHENVCRWLNIYK